MHCVILLTVLAPTFAQLSEVNDAVGDFSFALLKPTLEKGENTIHSSYSIWTALGMCLIGARGETLANMEKNMFITDVSLEAFESSVEKSTKRIELAKRESPFRFTASLGNRIYINASFPLGKEYVRKVGKNFEADVESVNFMANGGTIRNNINKFVANATHNLIPTILDKPLDERTVIALVNALYFKGSWMKPMASRKFAGTFNAHVGGGQQAKWIGVTDQFAYGHNDDLEAFVIELPYTSRIDASNPKATDSASMILILPDEKHKSEIQRWVNTRLKWSTVSNALKPTLTSRVNLTMPKFDVESSFKLSEILKQLGMKSPFSDGANFNGIVDPSAAPARLKLSEVIHKAKMMVDEKGTTAAAATLVAGVRTAVLREGPTRTLIIDRSFVSIIILRQENGSTVVPLFTAVVNKLS